MVEDLEEGGRRKEEGEMFEDGTLLEECGMWNVEGEMFKMSLFSKRTSAPRVWAFCFAM